MEGVEIKGEIDFRSVEEGYVQLMVDKSSALSLAKLRGALQSTTFELKDVRWPVRTAEPTDTE
ncbi:MAG: hypothetical protein IH991_04500 [Planctomycetes bacterium]|nr:hypothetical protein [Planctomycetota bacterium]